MQILGINEAVFSVCRARLTRHCFDSTKIIFQNVETGKALYCTSAFIDDYSDLNMLLCCTYMPIMYIAQIINH